MELIHPFDQRPGQLQQYLSLGGKPYLGPPAFEEDCFQFSLQGLDLKGHRWLAEKDFFRSLADTASMGGVTKRPQLLESILLVVDRGR